MRKKHLTHREREIAHLLPDYTYEDIGVMLDVTPQTIKSHTKNMRMKFDAKNKLDLVRKLKENNII